MTKFTVSLHLRKIQECHWMQRDLRLTLITDSSLQVGIAIFLAIKKQGGQDLNLSPMSHPLAIVVVVFICLYVAAFAWSWGPLSWLIPSEILTFDTRSAGQSIAVSVNMFFTFLVAQFFLSTLCAMKWGIFLFFGGWVAIMQVFVLFFVPETKGMHITFMDLVWKQHWYWKRFMRLVPGQPDVNEV